MAFVARDATGTRLVTVPTAGDGRGEVVVADEPEPAARGGVVDWLAGRPGVAYATAAGGLALASGPGGPPRVVAEGKVAGLAASPLGDAVAFVDDTRHVVVAAVAAGPAGGPARVVSTGADFALDPAWSPDGRWLAWHEWDVPAMPWDASRIVLRRADGAGPPRTVAGGDGVSVHEPRFAPDGTALAFVCDAGGWANLWLAGADGTGPRPLVAEEHEHAGPAWGPGARSFAWSPDSRSIAFCRNEAGFGRLCVVDVASGHVRELAAGVHSCLTWAGGTIACLRSGARTPPAVVAVDAGSGTPREVATCTAEAGRDEAAAGLVDPEVVRWPAADGAAVPGRLYRPPSAAGGAPPPLVVYVHGGPTGQHAAAFDESIAWLVAQGWGVLVPDYRGSTGWGRAWAQALRGRWGEDDVDDVAAGARAAVRHGWGDPRRVVALGGSAGGMTVLLLLARHAGLFAAGVAAYPVVDLLDLAATTHRYEAHYSVGLVGPLPAAAELHRARSPLALADRIAAPVLVLHGSDDQVVSPRQSEALAAVLRARGVPVERHVYEGEGHGWRAVATREDVRRRTEAFLRRHGLWPRGRMGR